MSKRKLSKPCSYCAASLLTFLLNKVHSTLLKKQLKTEESNRMGIEVMNPPRVGEIGPK